MRVKFWGVRGSIPTPLTTDQLREKLFRALSGATGINLSDPADVQAYIASLPPAVRNVVGGNTTCVEVDTGTDLIIIDCGSGMRQLGLSLMARDFGKGQGTAHIFLTHAHWDHLQGYPFFLPAYVPGNRLIFYAVNYNPQLYLEHQQVAPMYFPIPPNAMPADKEFVQLREGETVQIGRTVVSSLALYHPGTAYAYRFDDGESVFVFASDGEYKSLAEANLRRYVDFYANADALVFDSQFSLRDVFLSKADWGHSSAIIGVDIAERARVKRLITFHHEPMHSDEQVYQIADSAREYAAVNELHFNTEVIVGTEGLELFLGEPQGLEIIEDQGAELWTLALAGHLNQRSAPEAHRRLHQALAGAPNGRVLLDLSLLATLDAIGVKALIDAARAHPESQLAVLVPSPHLRRSMEPSGANEALKIFRNRQQALTTITGPAHLRLASATIGDGLYQIDSLLFADDSGVIYRGTDRKDNSPVLVRVVPGHAQDAARANFARQIRDWRRLNQPVFLPGRAVISDETWIALVSPKPEGMSLRDWRAHQPNWREVWSVANQLAGALASLHVQHIVYGGLRPEKIVVHQGQLQLARLPLFPHPPRFGPGTYRAPEHLRGLPNSLHTDVYLLGMVLYELLLGATPFAAETDELRLTLQLYSKPQSPRVRWPEIPDELEKLLLKALALAPEERFDTAGELLAALAQIQPRSMPTEAEARPHPESAD